jgi:site-specific DNA-methyltransferase (adenine-specific)
MADKVWKDATPEIKEATKNGEMSINEAYKEVRKEQNIKNRERVREKYDTTKPPDVQKKYRIIYADPPWMYDKGKELSDKYGDVQKHYPPMEIDDICNLPITELCEKDCVLFLWATAPKLPEALRVIDAWGFQYKTNIVWDKVKHNFGFYFSVRHELLLIAGRGSSTPDAKELHDSVIEIERSNKHSEKPKYFRELIDKLYTNGNRIELFAREKIDNWDNWGNEL